MITRRQYRQFQNAFDKLVEFETKCKPDWPDTSWWGKDGYEKGYEDTSFFSEAYLYNLIGKDDARTLLGLIRRLKESIGIDQDG